MARNAEKAQSTLFRWNAQKAAEAGIIDIGRQRRPRNITAIEDLSVCEKWRGQVIKEISRKVSRIQEPQLSHAIIRDTNDEINKLFKEKFVWERHISDLGGPNYMRAPPVTDDEGREVAGGGKGYRYFGRARELPDVKELFDRATEEARERRDGDKEHEQQLFLRHGDNINWLVYYGYHPDYESQKMVEAERAQEQRIFEEMLKDAAEEPADPNFVELPGAGEMHVPTPQEVEARILQLEKQALTERFGLSS